MLSGPCAWRFEGVVPAEAREACEPTVIGLQGGTVLDDGGGNGCVGNEGADGSALLDDLTKMLPVVLAGVEETDLGQGEPLAGNVERLRHGHARPADLRMGDDAQKTMQALDRDAERRAGRECVREVPVCGCVELRRGVVGVEQEIDVGRVHRDVGPSRRSRSCWVEPPSQSEGMPIFLARTLKRGSFAGVFCWVRPARSRRLTVCLSGSPERRISRLSWAATSSSSVRVVRTS